jgi:hypothetical protein
MHSKSFKQISKEHEEEFSLKFKQDYNKLSQERRSTVDASSRVVDYAIDEMNSQLEESVVIENKFRTAGYLPSEAEEILANAKTKDIGQCFNFKNKVLVKTPFNTVVTADEYIDVLQNQMLKLSNLNDKLTNCSFFGLINLAFKRLFNRE